MIRKRLNRYFKWALIAAVSGAVCGAVYAVSIPDEYDSTAVLLPESSKSISSSIGPMFSTTAVGMLMDATPDAVKPRFYADVIYSTPFLNEILKTTVTTVDGSLSTSLEDYLLNHNSEPWWMFVKGLAGKFRGSHGTKPADGSEPGGEGQYLSEERMELIQVLSGRITADVSHITRKLILRVRMQDPAVACQVANAIIDNLQRYVSDYKTEKNRANVEFIDSALEQERQKLLEERVRYATAYDGNMDLVATSRKMDVQQLEQEMNMEVEIFAQMYLQSSFAKMNLESTVPVFKLIQPPMIVEKRAEPRPALSMLRWAIVFVLGWTLLHIVKRRWE